MMINFRRITAHFIFMIPLLSIVSIASAQKGSKDRIRQVVFERGHTSAVLRGVLKPYTNHIYRFHARAGQRLTVHLKSPANKAEQVDVVVWVQSRQYAQGRNTRLLEGIDKGGVIDWSGELPVTGEYEIYVSNPEISNHAVKHSWPYRLEVTIK